MDFDPHDAARSRNRRNENAAAHPQDASMCRRFQFERLREHWFRRRGIGGSENRFWQKRRFYDPTWPIGRGGNRWRGTQEPRLAAHHTVSGSQITVAVLDQHFLRMVFGQRIGCRVFCGRRRVRLRFRIASTTAFLTGLYRTAGRPLRRGTRINTTTEPGGSFRWRASARQNLRRNAPFQTNGARQSDRFHQHDQQAHSHHQTTSQRI